MRAPSRVDMLETEDRVGDTKLSTSAPQRPVGRLTTPSEGAGRKLKAAPAISEGFGRTASVGFAAPILPVPTIDQPHGSSLDGNDLPDRERPKTLAEAINKERVISRAASRSSSAEDLNLASRKVLANTASSGPRSVRVTIASVDSQIKDFSETISDHHVSKISKILALRKSPILQMFHDSELHTLADMCPVSRLSEGTLLIRQGDESTTCMYLIISGLFRILVDFTGMGDFASAEQVDVAKVGTVIGEMGMLTGQRRRAFVQAASMCDVLELPLSVIRAICLYRPEIKMKLENMMQDHGSNFNQKMSEAEHRAEVEQQELMSKIEASMEELEEHKRRVRSEARDKIKATIRKARKEEEGSGHACAPTISKHNQNNQNVLRELEAALGEHAELARLAPDPPQRSLLHSAAHEGLVLFCSRLLHAKADPSHPDALRQTPLHLAVLGAELRSSEQHLHTVRLLLAAGARLTRDQHGHSPLDLAAREDVRYVVQGHLHGVQLTVCAL
eukprot:CAMPEP_0177732200 /NCGR_PEP_ID=MMETSP0484_2-20121128/22975_1 /TAXON_ID=354590 /ORGANISM="Rhodomonas lens, Strain RHODO" /LENGTH=503 /DNA_ID=CAMNT_0019245399 /DNA_START=189 /DNA_END=1697 /DNA_ORIENTATION=+